MPYKLDLDTDLPSAARIVVREQLQKAAEALEEDHQSDPAGAVHKARKNIKKSRSLLRLVRSSLGRGTYIEKSLRFSTRFDGYRQLAAAAESVTV
jgi:hypothetical protein